ncbi:MAG: hypothetical protein AMXMBFR33_33590 [Candidatus Xenobia bacterium]
MGSSQANSRAVLALEACAGTVAAGGAILEVEADAELRERAVRRGQEADDVAVVLHHGEVGQRNRHPIVVALPPLPLEQLAPGVGQAGVSRVLRRLVLASALGESQRRRAQYESRPSQHPQHEHEQHHCHQDDATFSLHALPSFSKGNTGKAAEATATSVAA